MQPTPRVVVVDAAPDRWTPLAEGFRRRGLAPIHHAWSDSTPLPELHSGDLALLLFDSPNGAGDANRLPELLQKLVADQVATLVWGLSKSLPQGAGPLVEWLGADASAEEVLGKVSTLTHYVPLIKAFERELGHLRRLGEQLNHYFNEIDQEMRLAGRLQRDFLPRQLPEAPPYSFHVIYRPASWVSGDMYDVFRIDEHHMGLFIADAMGHGVAAGLLTMFLRQALIPKRVAGNFYSVVSPAEALDGLNTCLIRQRLPNCQFVTAAYAVLDMRTGEVSLARAGHPYALHLPYDGSIREIRSEGSLLGLADIPAEFEETQLRLEFGDKLILYTDGVEDTLLQPREATHDHTVFTPELQQWARQPAAELVDTLRLHLDRQQGSLHPADDVTLLAVQLAPSI